VDIDGVHIVGLANLPGEVAVNASQMFSANLFALVEAFWNEEEKRFRLDFKDEIIKGCVITYKGEFVNEIIRKLYQKGKN
jgi:NAD(P) transhydrogenase subunit alpha